MSRESHIVKPESVTDAIDLDRLFPEPRPLQIDVGCGKGRFLLARAAKEPDVNFIGIDRLLVRLRKIDKKLQRTGIQNVRLLRIEALYALTHLLPPACVSCFYIFFPDPWPKRKHHRRRLFKAEFLDVVERALVPGGVCHVASDHLEYMVEIRKIVTPDERFAPIAPFVPAEDERTDFELIFREAGQPVGRISFRKH